MRTECNRTDSVLSLWIRVDFHVHKRLQTTRCENEIEKEAYSKWDVNCTPIVINTHERTILTIQ